MPLMRQLLAIEPLIALLITVGFGSLVGKIRIGTFVLGGITARVSLANLTNNEYAAIGKFTRQVLDEYYDDFRQKTAPTPRSSK